MAARPTTTQETVDLLVVGAGLRGLRHAATAQRGGTSSVLLVDRAPRVGGSVRTQRSEGFVCELGPPSLPREEFEALARCLRNPPRTVELAETARTGSVLRNGQREPACVEEPLVTCRGGLEDLLVAFHRELGPALRLGREVTALEPTEDGVVVRLGGESPDLVRAHRLVLATPLEESARLLAPADARLGAALLALRWTPVARVHLGWWTSELGAVPPGYGIAVEDEGVEGVREVQWCSNQFPGRSIAGRFLARIDVVGTPASGDDDEVERVARAFLAARADIHRQPVFRRVYRTSEKGPDGATAELAVRVGEAASRWTGVAWAT
ncbi:MAG: Protoporphyrinogen oxidase [Planctomycetota bacterium]|jgi:protoporphyrinogen oxidase